MLILTTNALVQGVEDNPLPDWPGLRVLVVLPGSGLDRTAIKALNETHIVVEWLQPPANMAAFLCDAAGWLEGRLIEEMEPLLCLDQPVDPQTIADTAALVLPNAILSSFDADGRLVRLVLGEMIASSPLLPDFLRVVAGRGLDDALFVDLLTDAFTWEDV